MYSYLMQEFYKHIYFTQRDSTTVSPAQSQSMSTCFLLPRPPEAQSAGIVGYTDCIST